MNDEAADSVSRLHGFHTAFNHEACAPGRHWRVFVVAAAAVVIAAAGVGCSSEAERPSKSDEADTIENAIEKRLARIEEKLTAIDEKLAALDSHVSSLKEPKAAGKPVIRVDEAVHDFGTSRGAAKLKHAFTLTNAGDVTLKITKVSPGCGCTVAGTYPKKLEPGQSGKFPFTLDTKKLRGTYTKNITITSNDPVTPQLRLTLRGENRKYVDVWPVAASFGTVYGKPPKERVIKITNNTNEPLELRVDEEKVDKRVKVSLSEKKAGQEFELRVSIAPPYTPGTVSSTITLHTNVDVQKTIDVRVSARMVERLSVSPKPIILYKRRGSETLRGYVRLTNYGAKPVKLLEAIVDDPKITVKVSEHAAGKTYSVSLEVPQGLEFPAEGRTVTLKTDDAEKPTFQIPIRMQSWPKQASSKPAGQSSSDKTAKKRPALAMIGKASPTFSLKTMKGKTISSAEFGSRAATVLNFVAPNCGFCKRQIPKVEAVRKKFEKKNVRFVNVSQTMKKVYSNEEVATAMKSLGSQLELAPDAANKVGQSFKATSYPTLVIMDKDGKIKHVTIGAKANMEEILKNQLEKMLGGKG